MEIDKDKLVYQIKMCLAKVDYISEKTLTLARQFYAWLDNHECSYTESNCNNKECNEANGYIRAPYESIQADIHQSILKDNGLFALFIYRINCFFNTKIRKLKRELLL